MSSYFPVVGNWYKDQDNQVFRVVAFDEDDNLVEIQLFEGEIDELDLDSWFASGVQSIAEPEDWSGPFDELEFDDLGYNELGPQSNYKKFTIEDLD